MLFFFYKHRSLSANVERLWTLSELIQIPTCIPEVPGSNISLEANHADGSLFDFHISSRQVPG